MFSCYSVYVCSSNLKIHLAIRRSNEVLLKVLKVLKLQRFEAFLIASIKVSPNRQTNNHLAILRSKSENSIHFSHYRYRMVISTSNKKRGVFTHLLTIFCFHNWLQSFVSKNLLSMKASLLTQARISSAIDNLNALNFPIEFCFQ